MDLYRLEKQQGYNDYLKGLQLSDNPYDELIYPKLYIAWKEGWLKHMLEYTVGIPL